MPVSSIVSRVPQRWVVCALCSLALAYSNCKNDSFFALLNIINSVEEKKRKPSGGCPFLYSGNAWDKDDLQLSLPDFFWSTKAGDIAYAAFAAGVFLVQVPAGMLSDIGYARYVLCGGMLLMAVAYLLVAVFPTSLTIFIVGNCIDGVGEALMYPSIFTLISSWAPPPKRNLFTAIVVSGIFYGDAVGPILFKLTYLRFNSLTVGDATIGVLGLVWCVFGFIFIYQSPKRSPFIRQDERGDRRRTLSTELRRFQGIPWRKIVTSPAFLSLLLAFCAVDWAVYVSLWDSFSSYQKYILRLPERFSDTSRVLVSVSVLPSTLIGGWFADWVNQNRDVRRTFVKKTLAFFSATLASLLLVLSVLVGCNVVWFWGLSISAAYVIGLANAVVYSGGIDLCPRYAGVLIAIIQMARAFFNALQYEVDKIVNDYYDSGQWQIQHICYACLSLLLMIPFLFFGSGEPQNWTRPSRETNHQPEIQQQQVEMPG